MTLRTLKPRYKRYLTSLFNFDHLFYSNDATERQAKLMARGVPKKKEIPNVKKILLVASGKGGVGKSTVAVNVASALAVKQPNFEVGLLDADVFGPSVPLMMNLNDSPLLSKENKMIPLVNYGVKCMSMGFLVKETSAIIWRGLMVMSALEKLLRQVDWGSLDVLIIDTPPGTGDTMLSLIQNLPIDGVIVVSTPQKAALTVTSRGVTMLKKLDVPIVGIVENMGSIECNNCCTMISPFGNGTEKLAEELSIPFLGDIPLNSTISNCSDSGTPIVIVEPQSSQAKSYFNLAEAVVKFIKGDDDGTKTSRI